MNYIPFGSHILVKPNAETEKKTAYGLHLPKENEFFIEGKIISLGEGRRNEAGDIIAHRINVDDEILFSVENADPISLDGIKYYLITENDISLVKLQR